MDVDERHKPTIFRDSDDYFFAPLTLRVHLVSCVRACLLPARFTLTKIRILLVQFSCISPFLFIAC